jgi:Fe-S cluster assembly scaffold protein SufB
MIVMGFMNHSKELPMEYAVDERLIDSNGRFYGN